MWCTSLTFPFPIQKALSKWHRFTLCILVENILHIRQSGTSNYLSSLWKFIFETRWGRLGTSYYKSFQVITFLHLPYPPRKQFHNSSWSCSPKSENSCTVFFLFFLNTWPLLNINCTYTFRSYLDSSSCRFTSCH